MKNDFLEDYINQLFLKSNIGMEKERYNLFGKKEYYELLKPVISIINENKDYDIDEIRKKLYEQSNIENKFKEFIYKQEMASGLIASYGTLNYKETLVIGNRQEVSVNRNGIIIDDKQAMKDDTIFDLASITKLFTSISTLILIEQGLLNLNDEVGKYVPKFKNIKGVTIYDLLSFSVQFDTDKRIDKASTKEEALNLLYNIRIKEHPNISRPYNDMGPMILKYIIEEISSTTLYDFIKNNILLPSNMHNTYVSIPNNKLDNVASTGCDVKVYDKDYVLDYSNKGIVYDKKARILGQMDGDLSGHAGLFSNSQDMTALAKSIIDNKMVSNEYYELLVKNRTGKKLDSGKYVQYHAFLCYSKHPNLYDSYVYHALSGNSFTSSGWTGSYLTVDKLNQIYLFTVGNRSHNRITYNSNSSNKRVILPDGRNVLDTTKFAWDRDEYIIYPTLRLALQYKMLEDLYNIKTKKEKTKYIEKK